MSVPPATPPDPILRTVERYYSDRLREFGPTPRGVDWSSADSQTLRFERLLQLVDPAETGASLLDVGCGYGALLDAVRARGLDVDYRGVDISASMIAAATERHAGDSRATFSTERSLLVPAAYAVASGIFNVKLHHDAGEWRDYVLATIRQLHESSTRGFAFNMLSLYSDPERRRDTLYYADPCEIFDLCKRTYSRQVALLHDYPLYEFTMIVRK